MNINEMAERAFTIILKSMGSGIEYIDTEDYIPEKAMPYPLRSV